MIHPTTHVYSAAGSHDHDGFLIRCGNLVDKLVLARKQFKGSIAALAFAGSVESRSNNYRIYARGQRFGLRRDQGFRTDDAQVSRYFTPSTFCVVIEFDLVRALCKRDRSFAHECVPLRPIVEDK